jgi:methyl-accepting chemotaxis protein
MEGVNATLDAEVTAEHVGAKLAAIVASGEKVTDIVAEISVAAGEQATGIDQIGKR